MALVVLVGLPGSGKTTVGRELAQTLMCPFNDADQLFFDHESQSVQEFLREHEESEFRELELLVLNEAVRGPGVLSTGGGVVTTQLARTLLREQFTVWLDCGNDVLAQRVLSGNRPLLGDNPGSRLDELRSQREPWYAEVSRWRMDSSRPLSELVSELVEMVAREQVTP